ncbi:MAG: 50S ribosomal protein L44e [Nanoarchaeota archaeon]
MKLPKETKRYCPHCKKHTTQLVLTAKQKSRSSTHPLSRWGSSRVKKRSYRSGYGNLGRFSKPGVKDWKRKTKITKKISVQYKCKTCGKIKGISKGIRSGRIEIGEKVTK